MPDAPRNQLKPLDYQKPLPITSWIGTMTDRYRIRTGYGGPENITRLCRFAIGLIKSKGMNSVTEKMRQPIRTLA